MKARRFPKSLVKAIDEAKILGIRAGSQPHRFIGVWPVVVDGRVFVRSWSLKPRSWYRTFRIEPRGAIQVGARQIEVRAAFPRSERLYEAIEAAYAAKYDTPASLQYVRGFKLARRRASTTELVPR
jgi:hypothetical protein